LPIVECPRCSAILDEPAESEGHAIKCPECGEVFVLRFAVRSNMAAANPPASETDAFTLGDELTVPGRRPAKAERGSTGSSEQEDRPWHILDLAALSRDLDTIVTCRVRNPEDGSLEITLAGTHNSEVIEETFGPNWPTPTQKEFATGRFPVGTSVSATLFDASGNARYQAQILVADV
jgi:hypothetical protein